MYGGTRYRVVRWYDDKVEPTWKALPWRSGTGGPTSEEFKKREQAMRAFLTAVREALFLFEEA